MIFNMPAIPCLGEEREAITWSDAGWIEPWLIQLGPNFSQWPDAIRIGSQTPTLHARTE